MRHEPTDTDSTDLAAALTKHHADLDQLFTRLLEAVRADARSDIESLWTEFDTGLRKHFAVEEALILPEFERLDRAEAQALRAEHDEMRKALDGFAVSVDLHLTRADAVDAFVAQLRSHAAREDQLLYAWADSNLPRSTQASVRERLAGVLRGLADKLV